MEQIIVTCGNCGARNRKNPLRLSDNPVCGKCQTVLPKGGGPISLDTMAFDAVLRASQVPVLVDFWAEWCAPCRVFAPVLETFAKQKADELLVAKVDTEAEPALAERFQIRSIPTLVLFRGPIEVSRQMGALPAQALNEWIASATG